MSSDYQVVLRSRDDGSVKTIFGQEELDSAYYTRLHNETGKFSIDMPGDDDLYMLFELDDFVEFERRQPDTGLFEVDATFFVRFFFRGLRNNLDVMTFGGPSLEHLLERRIIDPDDDPLAVGGYSIKAGFADAVIRELVMEQLGPSASAARRAPDFTVATVANVGTTVGDKYNQENTLYDAVQDLALRGGVDFRIQRTDGRNTVMTISQFGNDLTRTVNLGFTPMVLLEVNRGNLLDPALTLDYKDQRTLMYAKGEGAGDTRVIVKVASSAASESPFNRIETVEDFRELELGASLISAGLGALQDLRADEKLEFDIDPSLAGTVLGQDFDLYDKITAYWLIQRDFRVTGVEHRFSQQGETIEIKVSSLAS